METKSNTAILGYYEILPSGVRVHRIASELYSGKYHPDWKNNLKELGYDLRFKLSHKQLSYVCDCCGRSLYLAGKHYDINEDRPKRAQRLHLHHYGSKNNEVECVYQNESQKTKDEINKDSHKNKKESAKHFMLKAYMREALAKEFPECIIEEEKWIRVDNTRRRPDLNLTFNEDGLLPKGTQLAIEIQVNPILMDDINRRMDIDRSGSKYMMWVHNSFDPTQQSSDKLYMEDIFLAGGLNAFVIDEEAMDKTLETGKLHLRVWYVKYHLQNGEVAPVEYVSEIIPFSSLKFNKEKFQVYYYPSEAERDECFAKAKEIRMQREVEEEQLRLVKVAEEARLAEIRRKHEEEQVRLRTERLERGKAQELSKKMYAKVCDVCEHISNATYWEESIYDATEAFMHNPQEYIDYLFHSINDMWYNLKINNNNWGILIKTAKLLIDLYQTDVCEIETANCQDKILDLLKTATNQDKTAVKERFIISQYLDIFPNSSSIILRFLNCPNYSLCATDVNRAKEFISANKDTLFTYQKFKDAQQRDNHLPHWQQHKIQNPISLSNEDISNLKLNYAYWSAIILSNRIVKSGCTDTTELIKTMIKNWDIVTIFLSLRQGFIVGWGYNHWVQFVSNIKNKAPEFAPLFLTECRKHNYNLKSKKTDHMKELTDFVTKNNFQLPTDMARLFAIIFPNRY